VNESKTMTPAVLVAGAVLLASLGAAAGWLMHSEPAITTPPAATVAQLAPPTSAKLAADDEVAPPPAPTTAAEPVAKPQGKKAAPVRHPARATTTHSSGTHAAAVCQSCGVVASVTEVHRKGEANGVGAVAGGVIGGLLGNQMGGGNGKKAMTVVGAVGGGLAGHEIEKRARGDVVYQVHVRMDNGTMRTVTMKDKPADGARVVVEGQSLRVVS
jgi:outer membrane lipoprotein SlyB